MPSLSFQQYGQGKAIILIHGFPMNQTVWNDFVPLLSTTNKVITVDLPGFGKSPLLPLPFTIEQVADSILQWISTENLFNCTVIGHSLGGYVALALVEKKPELFSGLGLFHSTALADTEEKKESRLKVIEFIEKNGVLAFTSNFIPPLFSDQKHPAIPKVREIAMLSSKEAVVGYTLAMRNRSDRTSILKEMTVPVLFITGDTDIGIPVDSIIRQSEQSKSSNVHVLKNVAHMGMFENSEATAAIIQAFVT